MRPIWHFSLYSFKSYEQNKVDCPKSVKIQWPVPQRDKKVKYFNRRHKNYFGVGWDRLNICLTIRNHWKSGSIPTLKQTVEILNSAVSKSIIPKVDWNYHGNIVSFGFVSFTFCEYMMNSIFSSQAALSSIHSIDTSSLAPKTNVKNHLKRAFENHKILGFLKYFCIH